MDTKIVAIGGGEITLAETLEIDKEIIKLSKKDKPKVLFIPTASSDDPSYCKDFQDYYHGKLECKVSFLLLLKEKPSYEKISKMIFDADIIYVGGGNTL